MTAMSNAQIEEEYKNAAKTLVRNFPGVKHVSGEVISPRQTQKLSRTGMRAAEFFGGSRWLRVTLVVAYKGFGGGEPSTTQTPIYEDVVTQEDAYRQLLSMAFGAAYDKAYSKSLSETEKNLKRMLSDLGLF